VFSLTHIFVKEIVLLFTRWASATHSACDEHRNGNCHQHGRQQIAQPRQI